MKRKLFLLLAALLSMVSVQKVQAYTTEDLTNAGWTQVTDLSELTLADNYFVFVDAGASATAMTLGNPATNDRASYSPLADPFAVAQQVWMIAATNTEYTIQSYVNNKYFVGGSAGWNNGMSDNTNTGDYTFTINEGIYKISRSTGYLGPWTSDSPVDTSKDPGDGYQNIACNKGSGVPGFYLYSISRTAYEAARRNSAKLNAEGWLQVTSTSALGVAGNYYTLLDMSEAGYESGFAMTGATGGRPQSQALTNPNTNKAQAWMIASHDEGKYVLQCAQDNKYFRCDSWGWNTGFTDNIDADGTDFTFTLNSGKWTLSNEKDAGNFVGRWGSSVFHPFQGESIAANKAANAGKKQYLIYAIPSAVGTATELPNTGEMAADTWYYFDNDVAGEYNVVATALGDISYYTSVDPTTSSSFDEISNLAQARYYVKSTSANNLEITPQSYTYTIGAATVDKSYIQTGNIVTVAWADASTNDPGATFGKNGTPNITFNGSAVDIEATAKGFTFTVPGELTVNTEYTLVIPANSFGYAAGNTYNEAQEITLTTPVAFDGVYYFKVENAGALKGQYLSRGKYYGTHATVDKYGLAIKVATDAQNRTTLKPYDTDRFYRMDGNGYNCWADNTENDDRAKFNLVAYNDHVLVHGITTGQADDYFKYNEGDIAETTVVWGDSHGTSGANGNAIEFSLEDAGTQAAAMLVLKNGQATTAASAAYTSGNYDSLKDITTVSDLEAELEADYIKGDLVPATEITSVSEKYEGAQPGYGNTVETVYSNSINITEPGLYKFSMQAFYRAGGNDRTQDMHDKNIDRSPVVLYFGEAETQIKSVYDESSETQIVEGWGDVVYNDAHYPNNTDASLIMFQNDHYHNNVYVYISTPGEYSYGVKYLGYANNNAQWFIYSPQSVTVTSYAAAADADDYAALATAINTFDDAVWGFDTDEYAPYNNVEALENIEAAKAINPLETNSKLLVNSLTDKIALSEPNAEEVNAIYWPVYTSESAKDESGRIYALGWGKDGGSNAYNTRVVVGTSTSNVGIYNYLENQEALMTKFATNYGVESGYTMPLNANTIYKLSFKYGGMENTPNVTISFTDPEDNTITLAPNFRPTYANAHNSGNEDQFEDYTGYFVTNSAGNYILNLTKDPTTQQQIAMGNIELKSANTLMFEEDDNLPTYAPGTYPSVTLGRIIKEGINTVVLPFSMTQEDVENYFGAGSKVYIVDTYNQSKENITFATRDGISANQPCLLKATAEGISYEIANCTVDAASAAPEYVGTHVSMIGNYAPTFVVPEDANNYVISGGKFIFVDTDNVTMRGTRAYIKLADGNNARELVMILDDDPTAINSIEASEEAGALKDGKYFINGRFVIVNNGLVFGANGQLLK